MLAGRARHIFVTEKRPGGQKVRQNPSLSLSYEISLAGLHRGGKQGKFQFLERI